MVAFFAFKATKEISKNLFLCFISLNKVFVLTDIIDVTNIAHVDLSRVVFVHLGECFMNDLLSALCEWFSKSSDEFFISNIAISIDIVELHKSLDFDLLGEEVECSQRISELTDIQLPVAVEIHGFEDASKRTDSNTSSLLDLHFKISIDSLNFDV